MCLYLPSNAGVISVFSPLAVAQLDTYTIVTSPVFGPVRLGPGWTDRSDVSCAVSCAQKYASCTSFMYNYLTRWCTPGSSLQSNQPPPSFDEGTLYAKLPACDTSQGFFPISNGNASLCVGMFSDFLSHSNAENACQSKGGHLLTLKTGGVVDLVRAYPGGFNNTWVGCSRPNTSSVFVWSDDGQPLTDDNYGTLFGSGVPYSGWAGGDCCFFFNGYVCKDDCLRVNNYVCEIKMGWEDITGKWIMN